MKNKGFTLIEILVTTAILVLIFSIISNLFLSALKIQKKALAFQGLIKESSYIMEYMSRQLRMAEKSDVVKDCTSLPYKNYLIDYGGVSGVKFRNYDDKCWTFFLDSGRLKVDREGQVDFLTSADLEVLSFEINLLGDATNPPEIINAQPRITLTLKIRGKGQKIEERPEIQIQTTISQRNLDIQ